MSFFRDLLDGNKSLSSTRFSLLVCMLLSNISIFSVWVYLCLSKGSLVDIPESVIVIYSVANGISITGKLVQKKLEKGATNA